MACLFHGKDCWLNRADPKAPPIRCDICDRVIDFTKPYWKTEIPLLVLGLPYGYLCDECGTKYHGEDPFLKYLERIDPGKDFVEDSEKEKRLDRKFQELYKITEKQDVMNIDLIKDLNDDTDKRWIPLHMIDNANAIILGISRNRGRPKPIVNEGYVGDKLRDLLAKWDSISAQGRKLCAWRGCTHVGQHFFRGKYYCTKHHAQLERQVKFREVYVGKLEEEAEVHLDIEKALSLARNIFGPLSPEIRRRLELVIIYPSDDTWDDTHGILLQPNTTLWQAVLAVDPTFPTRGPRYGEREDGSWGRLEPWSKVPTRETLIKALYYATNPEGPPIQLEEILTPKLIIEGTEEQSWRSLLPLIEPGSRVFIDILVSPNFLQREKIRIGIDGHERVFDYTDWRYNAIVSAFEKKAQEVKARVIHGE